MKLNLCSRLMMLLICFVIGGNSFAQDTTVAKKKWSWTVQPYLMFPVMDGDIGIANLPDAGIHASASDIFSHLKFGAMLYAEAANDRWAITSDIIFMDLEEDTEGKRGILSGEAGMKQFVWEIAGLRRLTAWLEGGIGFRLVNLQSDLTMQVDATVPGGAGPRSGSVSETWVDPVIIGRIKFPSKTKWSFQLRGDLGGFGVGSDFTWQGQADVGYSFSKLFKLSLGYRFIGIDYEKGDGSERFKYDVDTYGPVLRFGFHF